MMFIEDKSRAYRTKGAVNKSKKDVQAAVDQLEEQILQGKEVPTILAPVEKPTQPVNVIPVQPKKKEPFMIDGNVIYDWLVCLKENKQDNKSYNADSKHLMDEILKYIDRQRVK